MNPHMMMPGDASAVKGRRIERDLIRRVWIFARPYRTSITGFLVTILVAALVALVPPFVFRAIIDDAIPDASRSRIWTLALIAVGVLLLAGGVTFALTRGGGSDSGQGSISDAANTQVAVLNSTSSAGLAAEYANKVKKLGYRVTPVGNSDQPFDSSVVFFEPAGEDAAGKVASSVGIGVIQPISPEIRPQAGGASVVVVLGSDKASGV